MYRQGYGQRTSRIHRATLQRILAREGVRRDRPADGPCEIRLGDLQERTGRADRVRKLLKQAVAGRQPDSDVTVVQMLDQYVSTVRWDVSTRDSNLG